MKVIDPADDRFLDREEIEAEVPLARTIRWAKVIAWLFVGFAVLVFLHRFYATKFGNVTGEAEWIWIAGAPKAIDPVVVFATRSVIVPRDREYFRIKVAGDPEYVLYVNGRRIGSGGAPERGEIDIYEIDAGVVEGQNRVVIAGRSATGYGGLIASVDFGPVKQNMVVTDEEWTIYRTWSPDLLHRDVPALGVVRPSLLGKPPVGRWDFLSTHQVLARTSLGDPIEPLSTFEVEGRLPEIRVVGGVAVAGIVEMPATVFDFGSVVGRLRIEHDDPAATESVRLRFASRPEDLEIVDKPVELVLGEGEMEVVTAISREIQLVAVYNRKLRVTVMPDEPGSTTQKMTR